MASTKALKPRKTAVQERSKFTVETIYEAAVQVFTENGYDGATTDLIAERAGVSVGTLYQYFPNKKAILIGIWDRNMEDADRARNMFANSFANSHKTKGKLDSDAIKTIFKFVFQLHKDSVKPHLFFEEVPQPDFIIKRLSEKESIIIQTFKLVLGHCAAIRKNNLDIAARVTYEVMERLIHRYLTHFQDEMSEDEFITEASDLINRYLFTDVIG